MATMKLAFSGNADHARPLLQVTEIYQDNQHGTKVADKAANRKSMGWRIGSKQYDA